MVRVITISREHGSGGGAIARVLAGRLGWRLVDAPLLGEIARMAKVDAALAERYDECIDPWFHRLLKALWVGGYDGMASTTERPVFDAEAMAGLWRRAIEEAAGIGGCVVVGRGGQCILQRRQGVFHVSIYAPLPYRIRRLRRELGRGADIERRIEETDRRRATYIRRYFEQDWCDRHLYNLMLCSTMGEEQAAATILVAAGLAEVCG